jgi:hypothetical protein
MTFKEIVKIKQQSLNSHHQTALILESVHKHYTYMVIYTNINIKSQYKGIGLLAREDGVRVDI